MRIIARSTIQRSADSLTSGNDYKAVRAALAAWHCETLHANWKGPANLRRRYSNASTAGRDRVVFSINGDEYRLVVAIDYVRQAVFVKWFGSHAEYGKIDVRRVRYES